MPEETSASTRETPLGILWRHRWLVVAITVVGAVSAAIVSKTLDPVYSATARLLVVQSSDRQSFDAVQAAQVTARTYSNILDSPNLATSVAQALGGGTTRRDVIEATSFEPIPETQLLRITAEAGSAARAQQIANTYAEVFERYAAERLRTTTQAAVSIADRAALPAAASRPKPTLYTLLATILAFGLGAVAAFVRDRLDTRIEDADDLERAFGLPLLGRVPRRGSSQEAVSRYAESFRMLRVAVAFSAQGRSPRSVLVTSASEGEGKTTTVRQLALASAEAGQHVIAVEADVYRPGLRRALGMTGDDGDGLTAYLLGRSSLDEVLVPTGAPNVSVVAAGQAPLSLASLLETDRGRSLVADLEERADLVILDCPPVGPRADAAVLAARTEAVLLVVDPNVSNKTVIDDALRALRGVRATIVGVVLNRVGSAAAYSAYHDASLRDDVPTPAR